MSLLAEEFLTEVCGPPPILSDIRDELCEYIECPEKLPIHQVENVQLYWPREPDILSLLEYDLSPVGTVLKYDRDPITGRITHMREDVLQGAGENAKNSMSMSRAPGPPMEGVQGNSSNFPFWPGGFDEPEVLKTVSVSDLDLENNLRTLAKGFQAGVEFSSDNFTPKDAVKNDFKNQHKKKPKLKLEKVNLMAIVNEEGNKLGLWSSSSSSETEQIKKFDDTVANLDDIDDLVIDDSHIPVLKLVEKPKSMQAEWAEQLDVSIPVPDFDKRVPKPAITFDYELDTFQKQAIIKLEEGCNVFVAAHTSAGKTTVAEYAIALSQRHMTRVIYTSPIKALSNQKYRDFKRNKHFESIGLVTGDMQINQTANCLIMTTEILQTMLYNASEVLRDLEYVIFDEVHYINDENRGHVWEEIVILLPPNVNIVMLSATVPNPLIFANWVGNIKKRKMFVISTLKRPVPLKHYLYTGTDGKTRNDRFLVLDGEGQFNLDTWYKVKQLKDSKKKNHQDPKKDNRRIQMTPKQEKTMWEAFIAHLKEHEKLPVVIFTLSRNRCDMNADSLTSVCLTTETEKGHVRAFFKKCIKRLNDADRELPQIKRMESLLERGIGVHHSGILPILKEIIELLFQNGVVKLLFATETFAMGINMPARTVVFDSIRKFDGKQFRGLLPTEYIQMAGRAGRRGHDKSGTVIIMCKTEVPHFMDLKAMMCGEPQNLQSQFKITYSMVLNLRRVSESVSVEDMMRRSFKELSLITDITKRKTELNEVEEALAKLPPETEFQKQLSEFYNLAMEYITEWRGLSPLLFMGKKVSKALMPGKVLIISYMHHYYKLAVLLNVSQKREEVEYGVLCLKNSNESREKLNKPENWYRILSLTRRTVFVPEGVPSHEYLVIKSENINEITNCVVGTDCSLVLKDCEKRKISRFQNDPPSPSCQAAIQDLISLSLMTRSSLKVLQPYLEPPVSHPELVPRSKYLAQLERNIAQTKVSELPNLEQHFEAVFERNELERRRRELEFQLSDESLALYPEYVNRVKVLKTLGYIDTDDRVTLKGRVALDMGTHELLITELVYRNILTNLQPAEIAALLSALVFQQKTENDPEPKLSVLKETMKTMIEIRQEIESIELQYGMETVEPLNFGLVEVVYEWAREESFAKIMELTDVQEGIIVRCIQQLNDTLKDVKTAANRIGETVLKEKMEEASTAIKRDIVFTASLYTQD
ncbi:SKI2 subunit of superkiller complex protein [Microplitis mediator]|uniref:SKI2 subunit of superkiller complex protein n=1 Tax=Microplitis mediator TaxID=375433 RepID=UPI00255286DC|nr:SKI2 subunit of superkiller complex protein [Microplitis mediator]